MNRFLYILSRYFLVSVLLLLVASSCKPDPEPDPSPTPPPTPSKSEARQKFESYSAEGLYIKGICILAFDISTQQKAINKTRKTYRIQSDDQSSYMHIKFIGDLPSELEKTTECTIHYLAEKSGNTMLVIMFTLVKSANGYLWLWNELQQLGVIVPAP